MSARDKLHARLFKGPHENRDDLLDAYRAEVIAKAIGCLRAVPVTCTALTGPVWYGQGWNDAITTLEEIADYQKPDDEAYPGELQRLRALALGLRVAALRKEDLPEAQRLLVLHAEHEAAAREEAKGKSTATSGDATPQLAVYRAGFDGHDIPLGLYDNAAAAREHCEAFVRREYPATTQLAMHWCVDEDDSAVVELDVEVRGRTESTGYIVTAVPVASEYDAEEDE